MENRQTLLNDSTHQMLVVFPLGLLATAVIFDLLTLWHGNPGWSVYAFYLIGAGVVSGLIATVVSLLAWREMPANARGRTVEGCNRLCNLVVVLLFAVSWYLRANGPASPSNAAMTLSFAGAGISLATGWLG